MKQMAIFMSKVGLVQGLKCLIASGLVQCHQLGIGSRNDLLPINLQQVGHSKCAGSQEEWNAE